VIAYHHGMIEHERFASPLLEDVRLHGFAFAPGGDMRPLLSSFGELADWAAFAQSWAETGAELPPFAATGDSAAGNVALRLIATQPASAGIYRLDQMIAALARKTLWLTDAYFVGTAPYVQALTAAARDGVDVRLLVPGTSDNVNCTSPVPGGISTIR